MTAVRWAVVLSDDLDALERLALRALWDAAFAGRFSDDDEVHAFGGVHVIARDGLGRPVVHASAVPRRLRVGDVWWEAGYVEAVGAFREDYRASCFRAGIDYVPLDTSMQFDRALMEYLVSRRNRF